jgi:hypothetical protein
MKIFREKSIRIMLLLAIVFCMGEDLYSDCISNQYSIEFSEVTKNIKSSLTSDIDSFSDDQIPQIDKYSSITDPNELIPITQNFFFNTVPSLSIWQPPKI